MQASEAFELVKKYLVEQFEISPDMVTSEANLFEDLELDSIDALDMIGLLETDFDIDVDEKELRNLRTVGDIVDYVAKRLPDPE